MSSKKKFVRPTKGKVIGGVCAGISNYYGWNPVYLRLAFVVIALSLLYLGYIGPAAVLAFYLTLCLCIPKEDKDKDRQKGSKAGA